MHNSKIPTKVENENEIIFCRCKSTYQPNKYWKILKNISKMKCCFKKLKKLHIFNT